LTATSLTAIFGPVTLTFLLQWQQCCEWVDVQTYSSV